MKKHHIVLVIVVLVIAGAIYQLVHNKSKMEAELAARKRITVEVPVTVQAISTSSVARTFSVNGVVNAKEQVTVMSQTSGQVERVYHDVGDWVKPGTPLAVVDNQVLTTQLEMAKTSLGNSERDLARFENLLKSGAASQQTVDNLRLSVESARSNVVALEKQMSNTTIKSPQYGTITKRTIEPGSVVGGGSPAFVVANLSTMVLQVGLTEKEVSGIKVGLSAAVSIDALGKEYPGVVSTVGVSANESGRYDVEVMLKNVKVGELRPDFTGTVSFSLSAVNNLPVIPRRALIAGIKNPKVFVINGNKASLRTIVPAMVTRGEIVVAKGLQEGDQVVLTGQFNLVDGTVVKVMK